MEIAALLITHIITKGTPLSTKPRIVAPDVLYQVTSKGVHELNMFSKDELKTFFLEQLARTLNKYSFTCYAFSITSNQYHLILKSSEQSISDVMRHLNSSTAKRVNKVLDREGTVFATRFKSLISEDEKLKDILRFVHLEPVKQGECSIDSLDSYKWCSHSVFMDQNKSEFLSTEAILKLFGANPKDEYREFMRSKNRDEELTSILNEVNSGKQGFQKPHLWILGKPDFVQRVIELDQCRRMRIARHVKENVTFEIIHEEISRLLLLDKENLFRAGQLNVRSTARELFVSICRQRYDFSGAQVAAYLKTSESAITRMISRFGNIGNKDYLINRVVAEIC